MSDTIFPEPMDQMDRAMQRMDKKAWAEVDAEIALLKAQLAEAEALLRLCNTDRLNLEARLVDALEARERMEQKAAQGNADWLALRSRLADAEREARVLVVAMADKCGAPDNWKPLPDAAGMITQISNMVAGLREERALIVQRAENAEAALVAEVAKNGRHAMRVTIAQLEARLQKVMARCADLLDEDQFNELDAIASSASGVQYKPCEICTTQSWCETHGCQCYPTEAMCCVDYPRCDCNSPPEPDNAPTLQPCGHPWKAQHDFKCILCSSPE